MKKVQVFTDGACKGNPGRGGWAYILRFGPHQKECWGSEPHTTNNRMELTAAVRGLSAITEPCEIELVTDSEYVKNGITRWIRRWKTNGWKTAEEKPVVNQDLWQALDAQVARHKVSWKWTKGHASHDENNRCDELASEAAQAQSNGATTSTVQ